MFCSFAAFGAMPLLGYVIIPTSFPDLGSETLFSAACVVTGLVLFFLGSVKSKFSWVDSFCWFVPSKTFPKSLNLVSSVTNNLQRLSFPLEWYWNLVAWWCVCYSGIHNWILRQRFSWCRGRIERTIVLKILKDQRNMICKTNAAGAATFPVVCKANPEETKWTRNSYREVLVSNLPSHASGPFSS